MTPETMAEVALFCRRGDFDTVDITGGAPELNPHVGYLIQRLAGEVPRIMLRSNLTALAAEDGGDLLDIFMTHKVALVASLPATNKSETDSIRGRGVWEESIQALRMLNNLGYGVEGTGLELDIAVNPAGAFLKPKQCAEERRFKSELKAQFGVVFNSLFALANSPLGRFRRWLEESGIFDEYLTMLAAGFNPCAVQGLMCRSTVSISWDGRLFDCDFNQAEKKYLSGSPVHVSQADSWPAPGTPIATGVHCYACTAGEGFTCGGAIEGR
jgi:radical SAM/Cys-rich protein